jgi:hypothetical protein
VAARLGLTAREYATLARLATPERIQAFINAIPANHEPGGETVHSVRNVLRLRVAHCIEGAFVAACALAIHGEPALVMHLDCAPHDNPHVLALFRRRGHWGAMSKSNGSWLRYREPVYRTLRELAMSFFHEFFDRKGYKSLRSYARPLDLRNFDPSLWVTNAESCWRVHDAIASSRHYPLVTAAQARALSRRDAHERRAATLVQYPKPS